MSSPSSAISRSAKSVRKLYGALIRAGRRWPVAQSRKDRSLWEAIPRVTKQRFGLLKEGLNANQIKTYGEAGVLELEAIRRLQDNKYQTEVRLPIFLILSIYVILLYNYSNAKLQW